MAFSGHLEKTGHIMLTSEGTLNRSTHVIEDLEIHHLRYLILNECEANWINTGISKRMICFCIGNTLVVDLAVRMGSRINQIVVLEQTQR